MRSSHSLDAVGVTFDDGHLVANAGLIHTATLAEHLGLKGLFEEHVDLGSAAGHANVGDKATKAQLVAADPAIRARGRGSPSWPSRLPSTCATRRCRCRGRTRRAGRILWRLRRARI